MVKSRKPKKRSKSKSNFKKSKVKKSKVKKSKVRFDGSGNDNSLAVLQDISQTLKDIQTKMPTWDQINDLYEYIQQNFKKP